MSRIYTFQSGITLKSPLDTVWDFFSDAGNLAKITPPEMDFRILKKEEGEVYEGMLIDYSVKPLFGIPVLWRTEICRVDKPASFTDRQLKGPYVLWEHTHTFRETENGVFMEDLVRYQLPLGFLGDIAHRLVVKKKIETIFRFRESVLKNYFEQ